MLKSGKMTEGVSGILEKLFGWIPMDPNVITLTSMFVALLAFLSYEPNIAGMATALILFVIAFGLDALDGVVARARKMVSEEGAFLDGVADRVVEFFLILTLLRMFMFRVDIQLAAVSILFFGTCMTAFIKAYAEHRGILSHERAVALPGLFERAERGAAMLLAFVLFLSGNYYDYGVYLLYIVAALSFLTFAQRLYLALYGKKD